MFDAAGGTWGNLYKPSGTGGPARALREQYSSDIRPQLMTRRLAQGAVGGDLNCIISALDSSSDPQRKMSPSFRTLVSAFTWTDSYRAIAPRTRQYSRYYRNVHKGEGA